MARVKVLSWSGCAARWSHRLWLYAAWKGTCPLLRLADSCCQDPAVSKPVPPIKMDLSKNADVHFRPEGSSKGLIVLLMLCWCLFWRQGSSALCLVVISAEAAEAHMPCIRNPSTLSMTRNLPPRGGKQLATETSS